jgi:hypothetical protein
MSVTFCHICEKNSAEKNRVGDSGLMMGVYCPVCHRPACSHHLGTVRWRWRDENRALDSDKVCLECKRTYRHRDWDPIHREWIS